MLLSICWHASCHYACQIFESQNIRQEGSETSLICINVVRRNYLQMYDVIVKRYIVRDIQQGRLREPPNAIVLHGV